MPQPADQVAGDFARLLSREVLRSERRRMLNLAVIFAVILALILVLTTVAPDLVARILHRQRPGRMPLMIFLPFIAYELLAAGVVTLLARRGLAFPTVGRYVNAFIETSFPTLLTYILATELVDAVTAFNSWPVLLYFLFIVLSTMRLDFALSAFTGAVAAVEFSFSPTLCCI